MPECIVETEIQGVSLRSEEAITCKIDLSCAVSLCGVDNNPDSFPSIRLRVRDLRDRQVLLMTVWTDKLLSLPECF